MVQGPLNPTFNRGAFFRCPIHFSPLYYFQFHRDICDFIVNAPLGKELIEWVKPQEVSDETFFSTIVHNPKLGIRGQFVGNTFYIN